MEAVSRGGGIQVGVWVVMQVGWEFDGEARTKGGYENDE